MPSRGLGRGDGILRLWRRAPVNSPPGCPVCAIRYVSEQFARKPLALRSRLHPQIPSMFVTTKKRADRSQLPFSWSRRRDLRLWRRAPGEQPTGCPVCAHRYVSEAIRAQTARSPLAPPPSNPVDVRNNEKESRQKPAPFFVVEATGFEPTTSWSRTKRATKLRYASNGEYYIKPNALLQAISMRQFVSYDFFRCFSGEAALPPSAESARRTEL